MSRSGARPFFTRRDLYLVFGLPGLTLLAWCLPERCWHGAAAKVARILRPLRRRVKRGRPKRLARIARLIRNSAIALSPDEIERAIDVSGHLANMQLLRWYRPGGWHPQIELSGENHLQRALDQDTGVVLWVQPLAFSHLVTKMAFHRAGYRVTHLSSYGHRFSKSRLGARLLNPIATCAENRYLTERLVMEPEGPYVLGKDGPERAMRVLAERLAEGGIVSITVVAEQARTRRYIPFLNGYLPVGDGAIRLARRTGAFLLPVFTVQENSNGFVTNIEPALTVPADEDDVEAAQIVLQDYGRLLEGYALRWPEQFRSWYGAVDDPAKANITKN